LLYGLVIGTTSTEGWAASDQGLATPGIWSIGTAPTTDADDEFPDHDDTDEVG
jgi:hypothetical protein